MGWSVFEDLLCVAEDGTISVYTLSGDFKRIITMGQVQYMTFLYFNMYLCCNEISFPELIGNLVKVITRLQITMQKDIYCDSFLYTRKWYKLYQVQDLIARRFSHTYEKSAETYDAVSINSLAPRIFPLLLSFISSEASINSQELDSNLHFGVLDPSYNTGYLAASSAGSWRRGRDI
jgi:hypothetical protein